MEVVKVSGVYGIQVNNVTNVSAPESNEMILNLPIPLGLFALIGFFIGLIGVVRAKSCPKRGDRFIRGGIMTLMPVVVIIVFVVSSHSEGFQEFIKDIAHSPTGGEETDNYGEFDEGHLTWGLGIGSYLLIIAGVMKISADIVEKLIS